MSEDEDYDELPKIFVHSSEYAGAFSIPSADELATQRERDEENKRKLSELRERQSVDDELAFVQDSSSSESEAVLVAAATGLSVTDPSGTAHQHAPRAAHLLRALAHALPQNARELLENPALPLRLSEVVEAASALVSAEDEKWSDDEVFGVGGLLAGAALAHDSASCHRALRALHTLLERRASLEQGAELCRLVRAGLGDVRARLELGDALRAGGSVCAALAEETLDAALLELLEPDACGGGGVARLADAMSVGWSRLSPELRYAALQLAGRRLASSAPHEREACARLLAPLAHAHTSHDAQTPDNLKVLVCASKLRLLFGTEK